VVSVLRTATISILLGWLCGKALDLHISRIHEVNNVCIYENMEPRETKNGIECRLVEKF
jgi:hypothetical protein